MRVPAFVLVVLLAAACSNSASTVTAHPAPSSTASPALVREDDPDLYADGVNGDTARRLGSPSGNIRCTLDSPNDVDAVACLVREKIWDGPHLCTCAPGKLMIIELLTDANKPSRGTAVVRPSATDTGRA